MSAADDFSVFVYLETPDGDGLGRNRDFATGQDQAVEFQFEPALAGKPSGVSVIGETSG